MRLRNFCAVLMLALIMGTHAFADDFCKNLKTAVAAARTDFRSLPGPKDDVIPGWRDPKLTLPYWEGCFAQTDKRDISYFCNWKRSQPAAVNAQYKYVVQQTDQCLVGFQKTTGDKITTWRNPAVATVTLDWEGRKPGALQGTETWKLMFKVKR
jgi:hypothetical protein